MLKSILSAGAALALVWPAMAQTAIDGDTIRIGAERFRLWGIDAPEARQTCADGWPAGQVASQALASLMQGRAVTCEPRDRDRYGRTVALCRADGLDLGE
ncbi:MAG TPA: thermonuclease family protein [Reyranella sp.]|nr:thermonuclease family protein [Reyranella sp.]